MDSVWRSADDGLRRFDFFRVPEGNKALKQSWRIQAGASVTFGELNEFHDRSEAS